MTADAQRLESYVRGILERDGLTAAALAAARGSSVEGGLEGVFASAGALGEQDVAILQKVERGRPLDESERVQLEAIVLPNGLRPSFDVVNDGFNDMPAPWQELNAKRETLKGMIRAIGRLDLAGNPGRPIGGTAFVVGADLLMTNRHVAEFFVDGVGVGASLQFKPGMSASVDFKQEVASSAMATCRIVAPVLVLETWDTALLRVDSLPAGVGPLLLSGAPPSVPEARLSAVVGYPAFDPRADLAQQMMLFRSRFDKKRLMPGRLMGRKSKVSFGRDVSSLAHDCTTLGGNSGSALIDIGLEMVLGLHFAGDEGVANYSVPTWELAAESRVIAAGVSFR